MIPGFLSPEISTARLREFLAHQGFTPYDWAQSLNLGPTRKNLAGLEAHIEKIARAHGSRVSLIGQSLGGVIAREMARRRPDLVAQIITLVTPIRPPVATPLAPLAHIASLFWDEETHPVLLRASQPVSVPLTAIITSVDGMVDWRASVPDSDPLTEIITVAGPHTTMGSHPEAQRVIAARLAAVH